jgi:filamentous hemagglutinin family protein
VLRPAIRISPLCASIALLLAGAGFLKAGNISTDGKVGAITTLSKVGNDFAIPHTLGTKNGGNLFHSFTQFDLSAGESATFSGPTDVSNILARVTGGSASSIDGTIHSTISGANLYFINPKGILFGPNASIDISGTFIASSAAYVKLADGGRFDAANPAADVLTSAPVSSFGFLGTPGSVEFSGTTLNAQTGKGVSVVAGNILMDNSKINAPEGRVDLVSARGAGELPAGLSRLNRAQTQTASGDIRLVRSTVDTGGAKGGAVVIRGGRLVLDRGVITSTTSGATAGAPVDVRVSGSMTVTRASRLVTLATGSGAAGAVNVRAGGLRLETDSVMGSQASSTSTASARAGQVTIAAGALSIRDDSFISASTFGAGRGSIVDITAQSLEISGASGIFSNTNAASGGGVGGGVRVQADTIRMTNGGGISADTSGTAPGGDVNIHARDIFISAQDSPFKTGFFADTNLTGLGGRGGDIFVKADRMRITDGGLISTKTLGLGPSGDTTVEVGFLEISRGSSRFFTGLAADTPVNRGPGGNMRVTADFIHIFDGGQISANTSTNGLGGQGGSVFVTADRILLEGGNETRASAISAESGSPGAGGDGGNVEVNVRHLEIFDGARISASTFGQGAGGDVIVHADEAVISNRNNPGIVTGILAGTSSEAAGGGAGGTILADFGELTIRDNGAITANTFGTGAGGDVMVNAGNLNIQSRGGITADSTGLGAGGDVAVTADLLRMTSGGVITASASSAGAGGSVEVTARELTLDDGASIAASSTGSGVAGSVRIHVDEPLMLTRASNVSTTSEISDSGTVEIESGSDIFLDGSSVTVRATQGNAGRIALIAPGMIALTNSTVLAEAGLNGGDVFIDPQFVLLDHSRISANAILGAGGNIEIIAGAFLANASAVTASSEASVQGTVSIETVQGDISGALVTLSSSFVSPRTTLQERCAMRLGGDTSTFLVVGRGGVSPSPEESAAIVPLPRK